MVSLHQANTTMADKRNGLLSGITQPTAQQRSMQMHDDVAGILQHEKLLWYKSFGTITKDT